MRGVDATLEVLKRNGVDAIFGIPGGPLIPLFDALFDDSDIRLFLTRHEQGAGHMAEGYAHATGKPGVCMVTSGPAATNVVTPLADAMLDSVPMVCITGQVPLAAIGTDAFQECDTTGITMAV
ncbi:MAG: thiamine pyrophosphate-binding protein, partial [Miltoncostaeaceae bacterium]